MSLVRLQDACWCFPEDFHHLPGLVPAVTWWRAGPAGTSKVPADHQRLAWAIAAPLLLGLPAKPDLCGNIESLYAPASFTQYDPSAGQNRLGELGSRRKSPGTARCCSRERRGCSMGRHDPHFAPPGENPTGQLCCSLTHVIITPATSSVLQLLCFLTPRQTRRDKGRVVLGCLPPGLLSILYHVCSVSHFGGFPLKRLGGNGCLLPPL